MSRRTAALVTAVATLGLAGCSGAVPELPAPAPAAGPNIKVTQVVGNLSIPWDLTWVGPTLLFDQRAGGVWAKRGTAAPRRVSMALPRIFANGEAGMLGMVADPAAATNGFFYTCQAVGTPPKAPQGVEVWKWRLSADSTSAVKVKTLITGIPLVTGRHSGCRLRFRSAAMLYVGTGDAARGANPQNLQSLGGKILRVRSDGTIPSTNPYVSRGGNARYVWNIGHRNVQGLAKRPGRDELWSVEQGTARDDEVNLVTKGHNYGWDPGAGYDESTPMTNRRRHPGANGAKWSSGYPTVATSGATFLSGSRWGAWNGVLAVAMLKGEGVKLFTIDPSNTITGSSTVLRGYQRIRTVQQGPDGNLYFTTSNGSGDGIYRVTAG